MFSHGLFDVQSRLAKLDDKGDVLEKINKMVKWETFLPDLAPLQGKDDKVTGGRPSYGVMLKFKMLVLQSLYNLSDENLEKQVLDRLSFMRFLDLGFGDNVPDANTIWAFREKMGELGIAGKLFARFEEFLCQAGFNAQCGQIIDATIVKVPIRRDSREINDKVKKGEYVDEWTPAARAQKDIDARWTQKNRANYFGYKDHIGSDVKFKFIRAGATTPASVHDSNEFESLLSPNSDPSVFSDSAYMSEERVKKMASPDSPWLPCMHERKYSGRPLTDAQCSANRERSRLRVRVEHIFGAMRQRAGDLIIRTIGLARARVKLTLRNLVYNLDRFTLLASRRGGIAG
jgi:IS5 family transposase